MLFIKKCVICENYIKHGCVGKVFSFFNFKTSGTYSNYVLYLFKTGSVVRGSPCLHQSIRLGGSLRRPNINTLA